jgi:two-component system sensor histidine kinase BaeS
MRIFTKLILTLFFISLLLLSAIFAVMQWSFDRGMLDYVNQKELESLQVLADNLSLFYQEQGEWGGLLISSQPQTNFQPQQRKPREHKRRPPPHRPENQSFDKAPPRNSVWQQILMLSEEGHQFPKNVSHTYLQYPDKLFSKFDQLLDLILNDDIL